MPQVMMFTVFDFKSLESKLQILPKSTTPAAFVQYLSCHSCGKSSVNLAKLPGLTQYSTHRQLSVFSFNKIE